MSHPNQAPAPYPIEQMRQDAREVMGTPGGRRFMHDIVFERGHAKKRTGNGGLLLEGRRTLALDLLEWLELQLPQLTEQMVNEGQARRTEQALQIQAANLRKEQEKARAD